MKIARKFFDNLNSVKIFEQQLHILPISPAKILELEISQI